MALSNTGTGLSMYRAAPPARQSRVGAIGDSITAAITTSSASSLTFAARGFLSWLRVLSRQQVSIALGNVYATGGYTTQNVIDANYHIQAAASNIDICVVHIGINDRSGQASTTIANLTTIYNVLLAAGKIVVAIPITPLSGGTTAERQHSNQVNAWICATAYTDPRIILADHRPVYIDATAATGDPTSGYNFDTIHPAAKGAYLIGKTLWAAISPVVRALDQRFSCGSDLYDASANPRGNLIANGLFNGTGGSITGSIGGSGNLADSWTLTAQGTLGSATCVLSKVSRSDGESGGWQQAVLGGTPGTAYNYFIRQSLTIGNVAVGDVLQGQIEIEIDSGAANLQAVSGAVYATNAGTGDFQSTDLAISSTDQYYTGDLIKAVLLTPAYTVRSGDTAIRLQLGMTLAAAAVSATARIGRASLRKVL